MKTFQEMTGQECPQTAISPDADPMRLHRFINDGAPVYTRTARVQQRAAEWDAMTPEEREAKRKRNERINGVQGFLMVHLFGWSDVELVTEGMGRPIPAKPRDGEAEEPRKTRHVKGWFGTSPDGVEGAYCPVNYGATVTNSRFIVDAMRAKGWDFNALLPADSGEWLITFCKGNRAVSRIDTDESLGVAECARQALEEDAARDEAARAIQPTAKRPRTDMKSGRGMI